MASIKKKVNVPTPIDERETFVSLRKNFAENEQLVQEKLKTLYELQNTDIEIDKLLQLRGELPEEVRSELLSLATYDKSKEILDDILRVTHNPLSETERNYALLHINNLLQII